MHAVFYTMTEQIVGKVKNDLSEVFLSGIFTIKFFSKTKKSPKETSIIALVFIEA